MTEMTHTVSTMMGSRSTLQKREKRKQRRQRRRFLLASLLLLAASPTFVAVYYLKNAVVVHKRNSKGHNNDAASTTEPRHVMGLLGPPVYQKESVPKASSAHASEGIYCHDDVVGPCCAPWHVDADEWWVHHPEWEVSSENTTHSCFERLKDKDRRTFLRQVYTLQWENNDCSNQVQKTQISSGYAAAVMATSRSFYAAYRSNTPFQISKGHVNATWNFAPRNASHWAYCATKDMNCYYLPLSPCPGTLGRDDGERGNKPTASKQRLEFLWLRRYAFRPRQKLRKKVLEFANAHVPSTMSTPCSVIHVRRGDIAFGRGRRYIAVDEYLEAGNITKGETVVVLTDDVSTIEEIERYHAADYNWVYLQRPRFRGSDGGFEGFIPSTDPASEILAILVEIDLAGQCGKLVHAKSGFVVAIQDAMELSGNEFQTVYLQNQQDKGSQPKLDPKERAANYLKAIEDRHEGKHEAVVAAGLAK